MFRFALLPAVAILAGSLLQAGPLTLGTNSLINGDAESGSGGTLPGWTLTSNILAVQYGASGGFPTSTDPGPASRGLSFFAGGPGNALSTASQIIDATSFASAIDLGGLTFDLSGYLGGFTSQADTATLTAMFLDSGSGLISSASIGPVTAADRGNATGLLLRDLTGAIPVGTRSINVVLTSTRVDGDYNDGYADNLSFIANSSVVSGVPEPAAMALVGAGLGILVAARRRFRS